MTARFCACSVIKVWLLVARNLWSRDEMILALNLYLKMPFGKMHKTNPEVIRVAKLIGRTPDAVA